MAWSHRRTGHGYHEWRYSASRTLGRTTVYADAVVTADSGDSDAPANWEVQRDGSPIAIGHAATVKAAKKAACKHLWTARQSRRLGPRNVR